MIFLPGDWGTTTPVAGTLLASLCDDYRLWEADMTVLGWDPPCSADSSVGRPVGIAKAIR